MSPGFLVGRFYPPHRGHKHLIEQARAQVDRLIVMVARDRSAVPVSSTRTRAAPLDHLEFLEPCVRAHYVKRVVVIGAESTGKTTLARLLAERFHTLWVPEFGREHWERKLAGRDFNDGPPFWSSDEFLEIATEQQARENAVARRANRILFADTNAFATGTWHERYHRVRHPGVDAIGARDKVDLYLFTAPDVDFVQDGFRDGEHIREWMDRRFAEQLRQSPTLVARIEGPYATRLEAAVSAVERLLADEVTSTS